MVLILVKYGSGVRNDSYESTGWEKKGRTFHARKLFCSVDIEWCRVDRLAMTDIVSIKCCLVRMISKGTWEK